MAMLRSPPATTPTQSTTSRRRSVSLRTTTSSTPTDHHPPTPPPESSSRPFPTPRRPSRSSPTGPRATIASAPPTWGSAATMMLSRRTRMASKLTQQRGPQVRPRRRRVRRFPDSLHLALRRRLCWENPSTLNRHLKDPRIMQVLGVSLNVKLWRPNSAEDADIPDAEMTEEEPESEDMDVPKEERKKEAHKEKEKGNAAYKKKDFEAAIQHYAKAIELDDKDISFLTNRAFVYLEMGQDEATAAEEEEAFEGGPSRARHRVGRNSGPIYIDLEFRCVRARTKRDCTEKDHEVERERSRVLREVEERGSERAREKARKMLLLLLRGRDEAAAAEEEEAFEGGPSRARHQVGLSTESVGTRSEFFKEQNYLEAVKHYAEAIKRNRNGLKAYRNGAACYIKLGAMPEGLKDAEKYIELDLSFARGYSTKGTIHFFMKEYDKALEMYQEGLKHEPRNQELLDGVRRYDNPNQLFLVVDMYATTYRICEMNGSTYWYCLQVLIDFDDIPKAALEHAKNPVVMNKIQKLFSADELLPEGRVPRNRYWGLHPPPAPLENVVDDGLMAVQRAVFLKKAGVETAVDDVFLLNPPNRADLLELAIENIIRALNRVEDMERLATSENCCVVVPRNRYWGLHPPPAPLENVVDDGLMAVQRAVFLKKTGGDCSR
ncbi:stress-inducible protein [Actinidia rufa]|uniref:Stress-inducible protein n=1 Tax=Actinidia rufa TaxID=165716 RepID=A0A7J0DJK5_9ERIC|nr:stress-inducible protein [Actinidia rufa]